MSSLFVLIFFAAIVLAIVFLRKSSKLKKNGEDNAQAKKIGLISIGVAVIAFIMVGVTAPDTKESNTNEEPKTEAVENTSEEGNTEKEVASDFDVTLNASAYKDGNAVVFDVETNLPDDTELMLTLSNGNYNDNNAFTAQTKVKINDGKAKSEGFSNKGEALSGDFDLSISMSLPSLQSDTVREVIGENGEHLQGKLVETASIGDANTVRALFNVSIGDEISITASDDYNNTVFSEDVEETENATDETESDSEANKEFISKYESDIVVAAKMSLDNFISDYKLSLAPQNWTIAKFDSTETTVIATSDITYNSVKGTYIYVGTLNIDNSGKVESATPHYIEVNGVVLGDDGYCDDVFEKLKALDN